MHAVRRHRGEIRKDALLHSTFLIIIILCSYADAFSVMVPARRLTAARGHSVVLGCKFSPDFGANPDLSSLVLTWQRQEDSRVVHSFYYEQDQLEKQSSAYRNRTALFVTELSKGNASVRIENVGVNDAGRYLCTVSTNQGTDKAELQLDYGAFYTEPRLTISVNSSGVLVQYETEGFPAPVVMWEGEHGENLTDHIQTSVQSNEETGLCYVKSSYTAPNTPLSLTFILENHLLHQYLQRPVSYTGGQNSCFNQVIVPVVVSFLFLVTAAMLTGYMIARRNKLKDCFFKKG
ncbi:V-set domain-containing T-cell activation inhibitor 1 [Ictalurus furcatus]|uniref:V-set domain-containing T-cell activation inhibitor 1 n=1 Tax=Ictalurus furcatus TaxID=66913 RepID=UPI002350D6E3|nr:V-set domain-containing T-cell activation inhibitor 1 [Ictalurus furcatus]